MDLQEANTVRHKSNHQFKKKIHIPRMLSLFSFGLVMLTVGIVLGKWIQFKGSDQMIVVENTVNEPVVQNPVVERIKTKTVEEIGDRLYAAKDLQEYLAILCAQEEIKQEWLPVTFDKDVIEVQNNKFVESQQIHCETAWSAKQDKLGWTLVIPTSEVTQGSIFIHDGEFSDEGHGGPSYYLPTGPLIEEQLGLSKMVYWPKFLSARVMLRGVKEYYLPSGASFYVSYDVVGFEENDSQLLSEFSSEVYTCEYFGTHDDCVQNGLEKLATLIRNGTVQLNPENMVKFDAYFESMKAKTEVGEFLVKEWTVVE